jgi:copper(I)-binding protein
LRNPFVFLAAGGVALFASATTFAAPPISISQPWFRYIVAQVPAGGYMTLRNSSATPTVLTGASSPACGMLMLHRSESNGGSDRMMHVASVTIPPRGSVSFTPGGYHLMCMQPRMKPGQSVSVALTFQDGQTIETAFPVFSAKGKPAAK